MRSKNIQYCKVWFRISLSLIALVSGVYSVNAQNLNKEVYVVSSFRPEVADADKMGSMPLIPDTFSMGTTIDYSVLPSHLKSDFTLRPIKPAKMVGTPLDRLYNSQLRLGIGNYLTPLIEYNIQNLRSKEYTVGAYAMHKSSHNKIDINQIKDIPAGYGRNELMGYGKRFYKDVTLWGEAGASSHKIRYYGLNTEILADTFDVERRDIRQSYYNIYGKAGIHSAHPDSGKLEYSLSVYGNYFWDHFKNEEPHVNISGSLTHPVGGFIAGLESFYDYNNFKNEVDTVEQSILSFYPHFEKRKTEWQLNLGIYVDIVNSSLSDTAYLYPDASFKLQVIKNALYGFVGITGYLEHNTYQNITTENPYIIPGINTKNTNHVYVIYSGVEGYLSRKASYRLDISLHAMEDAVFFLNSDSTSLQNQFEIVTDNADLIKLHAEIHWEPLSNLSFYLKSNYYKYKLYAEDHPWHRPNFELFLTTRFNFREKVYADLDFITLGKRYAQDINTGETVTLNPIYDLNLKLEYKFSNVLSFFLHFYNLTTSEYYFWNQYPVQRLNVIGGLIYKF